MLKLCLKTTYFRGRGPQRIRKVILFVTAVDDQGAPIDAYVYGVGFMDGAAHGGINLPALSGLTSGLTMVPPMDFGAGQPIPERILDYTIRTMEPRFHDHEIPCPDLVAGAFSFLDFTELTDNVLGGHNYVAIKCYHVPTGSVLTECGDIDAGDLPAGVLIPIELEYTSHSGAEG